MRDSVREAVSSHESDLRLTPVVDALGWPRSTFFRRRRKGEPKRRGPAPKELAPELAQAVADTLMSFQLEGTVLQQQFVDSDGFAPLSYKDSFALVRLIDDTVGFQHTIKEQADDASDTPAVN